MKSYQYDGLIKGSVRIEKTEYVLILTFNKDVVKLDLPSQISDYEIDRIFSYLNAASMLPYLKNQMDFIRCITESSIAWVSMALSSISKLEPTNPLTSFEIHKIEQIVSTDTYRYSKYRQPLWQ